jgi:hypothetical protein
MAQKLQGGSSGSSAPSKNGRNKWETPLDSQLRGGLTWMDVDAEDLKACLAAVTEDGAALLLSKTSDGGALMVQVLAETSKPKWYPASMAALNEVLEEITARASSV